MYPQVAIATAAAPAEPDAGAPSPAPSSGQGSLTDFMTAHGLGKFTAPMESDQAVTSVEDLLQFNDDEARWG